MLQRNATTAEISAPTLVGHEMYNLIARLFPMCRSITGDGVRATLQTLQKYVPLNIFEIPTGTKVFDWVVPKEWNIRDAFVLDDEGNKVIDFRENNLHVVGYSVPVDKYVSFAELQSHLYSLEDQPDAIPYITSYYEERWGLCITHNKRKNLREGTYRVVIDSELKDGYLTYGECIIPGRRADEVLLSTYICHPSMANNELSGPVVTVYLAKWLASVPRKYTYRIIFIPETIGSITYLHKNIDVMKGKVIAGFNISCVGDDRVYSFLPSRNGDTLADRVALNVLRFKHPGFISYTYLDRGSDERQYCSPGIDLPVVCVMRSKYSTYPEYHTSLDDLSLISPNGLLGSYEVLRDCIELIERNAIYKTSCFGEPQLSKRGMYPNISHKGSVGSVKPMMDCLAYADGTNDLVAISNIINVPVWRLYGIVEKLRKELLLTVVDEC
jgi:aminopeptidase-like protein